MTDATVETLRCPPGKKAWDARSAASITRAEVVHAVDEIERKRGVTSVRRGLAYARACYAWAVKRSMLEANPFQGIAAPGRENPRRRVLSDGETGAI